MAKQSVIPSIPWLPNSTSPFADQNWQNGDRPSGGGNDIGLLTNYLEAIQPMRSLIRPDVDTSATAIHRVAYPGEEYNRVIPIQGGSFPFHGARVITGPAGFTVNTDATEEANGSLTLDPNYMRMIWPNPIAGSHSISIGIKDQNFGRGTSPSTELIINFTLNVDAANFVTMGVGQDVADLTELYGIDGNDTTYQNRVVLVRAGNYLMPTTGVGANLLLDWNSNKPLQFVGYPGELITFDNSNAITTIDDSTADDFATTNIGWIGSSNQTVDNKHNLLVRANVDRLMVEGFLTAGNGSNPVSNENPAVITATDDGAPAPRVDWYIGNGVQGPTDDVPLFVLYNTTFTFENVTIEDGADGNQGGFYPKAGNPDCSIRNITYVGAPYAINTDWFTSMGGQSSGGGSVNTDDIEYSYCNFRFPDADISDFVLRMINSGSANGNYYFRRCTVAGRIAIPNFATYTSTVEDCVLLADSGQHIDAPAGPNTFNDVNNLKILTTDNRMNADGTLVDGDPALGVQGFELAGQVA